MDCNDSISKLQGRVEAAMGLHSGEHRLVLKGRQLSAAHRLLTLSECQIGNETTVSLVFEGWGGLAAGSDRASEIDDAFEDLGILRRCLCRIHRFSPGVGGRELLLDGDYCASLYHWSLIFSGRVDPTTVSQSSLRAACRAGRADVVELLVTRFGIDVHARDGDGWTVLHTAVVHGSEEVVRHLLALDVEDVATEDGVHPSSLHPELWARLSEESGRRGSSMVPLPLRSFFSSVASFWTGWDVPESAAEAVNQLVDVIAKGNLSTGELCRRLCAAVNQLGPTVLEREGTEGRHIGLLLVKWTVPLAAAASGRISLCHVCIEHGADVDKSWHSGVTPLWVACRNGEVDCARLLVDHGATVDKVMDDGLTPLYVACQKGHVDCVRLLLDSGADGDGETPLHIACQNGHLDCARLLLDRGADVNKGRDNGATPLHVACYHGHADCARLLVDRDADVDKAMENGETPLFIASYHRHLECIRLLLECGADVAKKRSDGATPLFVAYQMGQLDCARLLVRKVSQVVPESVNGGIRVAPKEACQRVTNPGYTPALRSTSPSTHRDGSAQPPSRWGRTFIILNGTSHVRERHLIAAGTSFVHSCRSGLPKKHEMWEGNPSLDDERCISQLERRMSALVDAMCGRGGPDLAVRTFRSLSSFIRRALMLLLERVADPTKRDNYALTPADAARFSGCRDRELEEAIELATRDRVAAIERRRGMDAKGPRAVH